MKRLGVVLCALVLAAAPVAAQSGGITGTVVDESGGILPGCTITLSGPGGSQTTYADGGGAFSFADLAAGTYTVKVSLSSFRDAEQEVQVGHSAADLGSITLALAGIGETIVVSASKIESTLTNAPATISVLTADTLNTTPASNMGDLLRNVPGVNVTQMSARDVQLSSRGSTGTLDASQIALLDGRSIYLDFFGFVLWDLIPSNKEDIKQIEVVRGPASAVWGANALKGVVNIITKTPREGQGLSLNLQGGMADRGEGSRADEGSASQYGVNARWADAPSDNLSYRISGGYFFSDPYSRPTGRVPLGSHPLDSSIMTGGAPYPTDDADGVVGQSFANKGTKQPKADLRVDHEFANGGRLTWGGGFGGTAGIIHTGLGPFDIEPGSDMGYGRISYQKDALKIGTFVNWLDVEAPNLLLVDPFTGGPVQLNFNTKTFDFEAGHSTVIDDRLILTYGGNVRRNNFEITITPDVENRTEFGGYLQAEYFVDKFRLAAGGRVDKFGNIDGAVFSPRVSLMFKPTPDHALRVSFNRAFRSPSAINNYLVLPIVQLINAPGGPNLALLRAFVPPPLCPAICGLLENPWPLILSGVGSEVGGTVLKEEKLDAYEVGYTGTFNGRTTLSLVGYQNDSDGNINFTQVTPDIFPPTGIPPFSAYSPANPPPLVPPFDSLGSSAVLMAFLAQTNPALVALGLPPVVFPDVAFTYLNLSGVRNRGFEASLEHSFNRDLSGFVNFSWQDTPELLVPDPDEIKQPIDEIGIPPTNRFNVGLNYGSEQFLGSVSVNYQDEAFWVDVLTRPFNGATSSFTMVNASFGVRFNEGRVTAMVKANNILNETIQQHVFGDILKRSVMAELRINVN